MFQHSNVTEVRSNNPNVTTMSSMFYGSNATTLDLSSFDTSNVTTMMQMFAYCNSLTSLDLSSFDTSKVTNMSYMFAYCSSLTSLDLGSFDTSKVTNMSSMFRGCTGLTSLDLSSFDTSNVTFITSTFQGCSSIITAYARTQVDANKFNSSSNKPSNVNFVVKHMALAEVTDAWYQYSGTSYEEDPYQYDHVVEISGSEFFPEKTHLQLVLEVSNGPGEPWNVYSTVSASKAANDSLRVVTDSLDIERAKMAFYFAGRVRWTITFPDYPEVTLTHTEVYWSMF